MQDDFLKNNKDFDAEFVDAAWKDMHALLDEEMPIEKPARRFFFWWFPLGAVGLVLMTYFVWNFDMQNRSSIENSQVSEIVIENNEKAISKKDVASSDFSVVEKDMHENLSFSKTKLPNPKIKTANPEIHNKIPKSNSIQKEQRINSSILKKSNKANENTSFLKTVEVFDFKIPQQNLKNACNLVNMADFDALKNKLISKQVEIEKKEIELNSKTVEIRKINPFQFGVQSGISIFNNRLLGYSIGTDIAYQISNKWSADLGVNYYKFKNNFNRNADYTSNQFNNNFESSGANNNPDMAKSENQDRQNQVTNMLEIPLEIQFSIHPRWKISSGIQYEISLSKVKAQQISYIGEVDFNFNRHLYTGFNYSKALSKTKLPNFGLGLKLGYRF